MFYNVMHQLKVLIQHCKQGLEDIDVYDMDEFMTETGNTFAQQCFEQIKENKKVTATLLLTGGHLQEENPSDNKEFSSFVELGNKGDGVANFDLTLGMDRFLEEILLKFNEIDNAVRMNVDKASKAFKAYFQMEITVIKIG
jgi:hypothetical protein